MGKTTEKRILTLQQDPLHAPLHDLLGLLQLVLVLRLLAQQAAHVRVRGLDHGVERVRVPFAAIAALQPRDYDLKQRTIRNFGETKNYNFKRVICIKTVCLGIKKFSS